MPSLLVFEDAQHVPGGELHGSGRLGGQRLSIVTLGLRKIIPLMESDGDVAKTFRADVRYRLHDGGG